MMASREGKAMGLLRLVGLVLTVTLVFSSLASATIWQVGDVITFSQNDWGDSPATSTAAALLVANFNSEYRGGGLQVGIPGTDGFSMVFLASGAVLNYLPASGAPDVLNTDLVDPVSSSSGIFGGVVVALQLNVNFSRAGLTLGALGIPFGDLILTDFGTLPDLNGLTVREFLAAVSPRSVRGSTSRSRT